MSKINSMPPAELRAFLSSDSNAWGRWASADEHVRYAKPVDTKSRRRCHCGCKRRATHKGFANGMCLTTGCEFFIMRWVRDGTSALRARAHKGEG